MGRKLAGTGSSEQTRTIMFDAYPKVLLNFLRRLFYLLMVKFERVSIFETKCVDRVCLCVL